MWSPAMRVVLGAIAAVSLVQAIEMSVTDTGGSFEVPSVVARSRRAFKDSIKAAASTIAFNLMSYYTGNKTGDSPGVFPQPPYYWWESGGAWGGMVEYWHYTGDTSYNQVVAQAILSQASPTNDFMMPKDMGQLGNDDQVFWGLTAMTAAERSFPNLSTSPSYIDLATNVFNDMASPRWNTSTCAGGLQWQFNPSNSGFYYKSSIANGGFFQLAARLARYTGNSTYSEWAEKTYDWMARVGLIDASNFNIYDGTDDTINCTQIDHDQWSYNAGTLLLGSAVMANISAENATSPWENRTQGLLDAAGRVFFSPFDNATNVMYEFMCEKASTCDVDQLSFKAYLSRWMVAATQMMPSLKEQVLNLITSSATAAATSCSGNNVSICGTEWYVGGWDGTQGLGQQLAALDTVQGLLVNDTQPPLITPKS